MDITDASNYPGHADQLFTPKTESESGALLKARLARENPRNHLRRPNRIGRRSLPFRRLGRLSHAPAKTQVAKGRAVVGPGVLLREVQSAAANSGQFYAPDPTENTSSIGGNIAANSSGSRSFRYGATRRHVLSLRVAFMDGSIQTFRRGEKIDFDVPKISLPHTTKHSAGYPLAPKMEWVDLIVGNEGTLGVVTEAELQFLPAPGERLGGVVFCSQQMP